MVFKTLDACMNILFSSPVLFMGTILIWGSTWTVINFQTSTVPAELSVFYRFAIASFLLMLWCLFKKISLSFSLIDHVFLFLQGALMFCLNYYLAYEVSHYVVGGLNAVLFSTVIFFNIMNARLFFKRPITAWSLSGAVLGFAGLFVIFMPELAGMSHQKDLLYGVLLGLGGSFSASLGNMVSLRNSKAGIGIAQANALGMFYGSLLMLVVWLLKGESFVFDVSFPYVSSLLYLILFGSILAFGAYLNLIHRIGPEQGAYALVLVPPVALTFSYMVEGYMFSKSSIIGIMLLILGNILIMSARKFSRKNKQI